MQPSQRPDWDGNHLAQRVQLLPSCTSWSLRKGLWKLAPVALTLSEVLRTSHILEFIFFFLQTFEYLQYVTEITWDCDLNLNLKFSYGSNLPSIHSLKVVVYSIYNSPVLETKVHGMQFATHALCQKFQVWDHLDFKCSGERCSQFESHSWDNLWRTESSKGFWATQKPEPMEEHP